MDEIAHHCFAQITAQPKRPLLVAVTGDSGSGKSYLSSLIKTQFEQADLAYTALDFDDFLIARKDREPMKSTYYTDGKFTGKSHWEILENMFRLDEAKTVIGAMRAGKAASYYPYSRATGEVSDIPRQINPAEFILFDTSMLLDEMDFVILVDVNQKNIIQRKLIRDRDIRTPEAIIDMHTKVQGYYWEDRGKPRNPDIIIDNNDFTDVKFFKG